MRGSRDPGRHNISPGRDGYIYDDGRVYYYYYYCKTQTTVDSTPTRDLYRTCLFEYDFRYIQLHLRSLAGCMQTNLSTNIFKRQPSKKKNQAFE